MADEGGGKLQAESRGRVARRQSSLFPMAGLIQARARRPEVRRAIAQEALVCGLGAALAAVAGIALLLRGWGYPLLPGTAASHGLRMGAPVSSSVLAGLLSRPASSPPLPRPPLPPNNGGSRAGAGREASAATRPPLPRPPLPPNNGGSQAGAGRVGGAEDPAGSVEAYVGWLAKIDQERLNLYAVTAPPLARQLPNSPLLPRPTNRVGIFDNNGGSQAVVGRTGSAAGPLAAANRRSWQALLHKFMSQPAPPECVELQTRYAALLQAHIDWASGVRPRAAGALVDPLAPSPSSALQAAGDAADHALGELCLQQAVERPFSVVVP